MKPSCKNDTGITIPSGPLRKLAWEKFCLEYVKTGSAEKSYISAGYSKGGAAQAATKLLRRSEIRARIADLQGVISANVVQLEIGKKDRRLVILQDRLRRIDQVIRERAADPKNAEVAGGTSGILVHSRRGVGAGAAAEVVDEWAFDAALLREEREVLKQAAIELGQWVEKREEGLGDLAADLMAARRRVQEARAAEERAREGGCEVVDVRALPAGGAE